MKGLLITACSLFLFGATYAQDNGSDDDGITNEKINLDGSPLPGHDAHHGMHWNHLTTLALSPLQYTENGVGGGISYERALDHKGIISVYVPAIATFNLKHSHNDYYNNYNNYYYNDPFYNNKPSVMLYLMPGVKFYPTGMGKVKYAIGPNAVIGVGQKNVSDRYYMTSYYNSTSYYPGYYVPYSKMENRLLLGMMINNSLNINATEHLYVGAEMGFGFTYYDKVGNYNEGVNFLTQGAFKIGYTF